eukprot:TRINITY_DN59183_c0_g1_i1.p1 TRINITY_DN59183_c0_g1~~TRINITY_DN59183_c0_g1_i1.p1  ORF type:complete len:419 (-),score=116.52 TRINITY_DN59183_c0_g1_i1:67-1323(-)
MAADLLKSVFDRESCFLEGGGAKIDAIGVCHELRKPPTLAAGEKFVVSFCEASARGDAVSIALGEPFKMKCLKLDAVVVVRLWATRGPHAAQPRGGGYNSNDNPTGGPRVLGEVRIPLRSLVASCKNMLYHTWFVLTPITAASLPSGPRTRPSDLRQGLEDDVFSRALAGGQEDSSDTKICLSLLRPTDLETQHKVLWTADIGEKERIARWVPLLRAHEQSVVLCAHELQHQDADRWDPEKAKASHQLVLLEDQAREQQEELQELQQGMDDCRSKLHDATVASYLEQARRVEAARQESAAGAAEKERGTAEKLKRELEGLQHEIAMVGEKANAKIGAANDRIRSLRTERDDAIRELETYATQNDALVEDKQRALADNKKLTDQKAALMKIVEDLHNAVDRAGLGSVGRKSIEALGTRH